MVLDYERLRRNNFYKMKKKKREREKSTIVLRLSLNCLFHVLKLYDLYLGEISAAS